MYFAPESLNLDGATDKRSKWIMPRPLDPTPGAKQGEPQLPLTEQEIQDDVRRMRRTLALIDQPTLTTLPNRAQSEGTQSWAQDAINDITSKCKEIIAESAFTPITTTTGFGQRASRSNQFPGERAPTGHSQRQSKRVMYNVQDVGSVIDTSASVLRNPLTNRSPDTQGSQSHHPRHLSRLIYKAQDTSSSTTSSTSSLENPLLSTPPNSEPQIETPATGIMSETQSPATCSMKDPRDYRPSCTPSIARRSTSRTFTSTTMPGGPEESSEEEIMAGPLEQGMMKVACRHGGKAKLAKYRGLKGELTTFPQMMLEIPHLEVRIPGSYPVHLGEGGDIAGHSNGKRRERGGLWQAVKDVFSTTKACLGWMIEAYWYVIKPVFDSREELTWLDVMRLGMALPVLGFMLMSLVWAMKLTSVAFTCSRHGSQAAWDELMSQLLA